ncbi:type I polyketide synthase [Herbidospora cretacea]|uniref:type I polyketide synthase n=1 Tax=Herbidospora cretacea TaxID=28444 RepID=UPI0007730CA3|nr:type I polyketide synthase [Herbidospora cretacea]
MTDDKLRYFLKRVTAELHETRERLRKFEAGEHEPIALVGMGCRFPGGVRSPEDLWELVRDGRDAVGPVPRDRHWDGPAEGGFLGDAAAFDAGFFGIAPREALAMDPQQRLLLETSWETFERAGIDPGTLKGSRTGVFVGASSSGYTSVLQFVEGVDGHVLTGTTTSVASGRIAYTLGFEGPAVTVDTACSSSLVALHLACQAIRNDECSMALAGGVAVMATPGMFSEFGRQQGLAGNGRCKSFAAAADGTGWAEGVGMLLVERLSDAVANGHRVLAVIRGSAVNQDGASNGLTAPNGPSQQRVIRQALASAGLTPAEVDAVEAHGTGTVIGDPIEAQALIATYGQDRPEPLWLGSIKSNIGHAQAAAGVGGVIKMVMAMRHGQLPKTLHLDEPTPHVDWAAGNVALIAETRPWPETGHPKRAAVSSFGISGTNVHTIIEEAPETVEDASGARPAFLPWLISGRSAPAVRAQAARLRDHLGRHPELDPLDVAFSLATTRAALDHRAVFAAPGDESPRRMLDALAGGQDERGLVHDTMKVRAKAAFLFTGQGAQRPGMGRELHAGFPAFAHAFDEVCAALEPKLGLPLRSLVLDGAELDRTVLAQSALFAFEVALFRLVGSWGVTPSYLIGHSVGELAAAHCAGVLSLDDACTLLAARATLMQALPEGGAMVAVQAAPGDISGNVDIAAVNGPASVVISGDEAAVLAEAARFEKTKRLTVSHAFHSALMEPMLAEFRAVAAGLTYHAPTIPIVSTVTGGADLASPGYWVRQVREAVRFADAVDVADRAGVTAYLELGPDGVLSAMAQECAGDDPLYAPATRRGRGEPEALTEALARLHARGVAVDWAAFFAATGARRVDLPTYAFQTDDYWPAPATWAGDPAGLGLAPAAHPLLGAAVSAAGADGLLLTGRLSLATHPWLADHAVMDTVLLPGTAFVELALKAAEQAGCDRVEDLTLEAPLVLPEEGGVQIQVWVGPAGETGRPFAVHSRTGDDDWTRHAEGVLTSAPVAVEPLGAWPPANATPIPVEDFYPALAAAGFGYGPAFQGLRAAWRVGPEVCAEVALEEADPAFAIHPALLDAALHGLSLRDGADEPLVPFAWRGVSLLAPGASALRVRLTPSGETAATVRAWDESGAPVLSVESLAMRPHVAAPVTRESLFKIDWAAVPARETLAGTTVVVGETDFGLAGPSLTWYADPVALDDAVAAGAEVPRTVLYACHVDPELAEDDVAFAVRLAVQSALAMVRSWLGDPRFADSRLVFVTRRAVAVGEEDVEDLVQAPVWGLVRSAQSEHPGVFTLLDLDGPGPLLEAVATGEPQVAVRDGRVLAPRLARAAVGGPVPALDPDGLVVVTGATGSLGRLITRHLVTEHGVRNLLLLSRSGGSVDAGGVTHEAVACDAADRDALEEAVAGRRIAGVVHAAGVLDDGVVEGLTPDQIDAVLRPKADAALNLHELAPDADLFVLFSSASSIFGGPGQANYAAANAFLDALAARRRAAGRQAQSLAFGLWAESGMSGRMDEADLRRLSAAGLAPLTHDDGLRLFDQARAAGDALLVPVHLDTALIRSRAAEHGVAPIFQGLVRVPARRAQISAAGASLARRLSGLPEAEQDRELLTLVRTQAALVLGHGGADAIDGAKQFTELGFDSLMAVEFRNRLGAAVGTRLPATLIFDFPNPVALAGHLRGLLLALPEEAAPAETVVAAATDEPIAIVGMGCRYPGGVRSPEDLWRLVSTGGDGVSGFPGDRGWDLAGMFSDDPERPGATYVREGGFLHDAADFDAAFFGISPREALAMDPQQRILLETAWEAFENAGIDPATLKGSRTGVFAGVMYYDYASRLPAIPSGVEGYLGTGNSGSVISGRLSYVFGLEGPAVTVDTACSSSLVALHWAIQSLRRGECTMALAGGVTVMSTPGTFVDFGRQRGLAADGRCKAFAAAADGTGWAEGAGVLVVERLSDAVRNGHRVLAVVRGSAVNQDGASNGLTAPNGPSQQRVIRQALASAGLVAADVDVVEGHGTGTPLGDPIEAQALLATYGQERETPLLLGSIKSNIGHTQAAAGVAGIIKMIMSMRHETVPRTLHVDEPSPHVDWSSGEVELLTEQAPWPSADRPKRAGVSSFGISGTNAHVILEEPPVVPAVPDRAAGSGAALPWLLSARSPEALRAQAARLAEFLLTHPVPAEDVAYSLVATRAALEHRAAVTGPEGLAALAAGDPGAVTGVAKPGGVAFLFSGQGSQRAGMGRELAAAFPLFGEVYDGIVARFDGLAEAVATGDGLDRTRHTQAAIFAYEVALFRLVESLGVRPGHLAGHSIGEIAAAHVAGVFSLDDACALVRARGTLMQALPAGGAMIAVQATEDEVLAALTGEARVAVAAVNSPDSLVVSGPDDEVTALAAWFADQGRRTHRLAVSHAFHSPLMAPMLDEFRAVAAGLTYRDPEIPVVSNVTGAIAADLTSPDYWVRHVRQAVRFADGVRTLLDEGVTTFVEIGPDSTLTAMAAQCADRPAGFVALSRAGRDEPETLLAGLAELHVNGVDVDWTGLVDGHRADLPTYAFQRERYWMEAPPAPPGDVTSAGLGSAGHPLLGAAVPLADSEGLLFTGRLSAATHPWLADHAVMDTVLLPGSAFVELALHAGEQTGCPVVDELTLEAPLVLPEDVAVQLQLVVGAPDGSGRRAVTLHSRLDADDQPWTRHADGLLSPLTVPGESLTAWPPPGAAEADMEDLYDRLAEAGFSYGPLFQGLQAAWRDGEVLYAEVALPDPAQAAGFALHPALLDAALHTTFLGSGENEHGLPFAWTGVAVHSAGATRLRVRLTPGDSGTTVDLASAEGTPVATVTSLVTRGVSREQLAVAGTARHESLFQVDWVPVPAPGIQGPVRWAVLGEADLDLGPDVLVDRYADLLALDEATTPVPPVVVAHCSLDNGDLAEIVEDDVALGARVATQGTLTLLQSWLSDARYADSTLVLMTTGAVAPVPDEAVTDLAFAAVWGLVRSTQSEHPGRIVLADAFDATALPAAVSSGEPQVALRDGRVLAPRLSRVATGGERPVEIRGPVLVTGATGALGGEIARHLVVRHGVTDLVLTSRRGPGADLVESLTALGANVVGAACDAADRDAVEALLATTEIGTVVHAAGVVDDGVLFSLTPERLENVLRPKIDAAWNLHELLPETPLILFSSVAGVFGAPGQGNYAAANAFLDALAGHRRAHGTPALSLAWGLWEEHGADADVRRMGRGGVLPLPMDEGLALLDAALAADAGPVISPMRLDTAAFRAAPTVPPLLRGLVKPRVRRDAEAVVDLARRLAGLPATERDAAILETLRQQVAGVLGHATAGAVDEDRSFRELGFDSLMAVELRNRLGAVTGSHLPATLVFDYPTPGALAAHLRELLVPEAGPAPTPLLEELDRLESVLSTLSAGALTEIAPDEDDRKRITQRLKAVLSRWDDVQGSLVGVAASLESASDDEIFDFIDRRFGKA